MAKKYTAEERAAADRLDININTLYNWLSKDKKHEEQTRPKPTQAEMEHELEELRKALAEKETELEGHVKIIGMHIPVDMENMTFYSPEELNTVL